MTEKIAKDVPRPVPVERWGRDHWHVLAYIETRCVDYRGIVTPIHMRVNIDRHADRLRQDMPVLLEKANERAPTRLKDDWLLKDHDDYDCADDLVAAGLVTFLGHDLTFSMYRLTDKGWRWSSLLRRHRADLKEFSTFVPPTED